MLVKVYFRTGAEKSVGTISLFSIAAVDTDNDVSAIRTSLENACVMWAPHSPATTRRALQLFAAFVFGQHQQLLSLPSLESPALESVRTWTLDLTKSEIEIQESCEPISSNNTLRLDQSRVIKIKRAPQPR